MLSGSGIICPKFPVLPVLFTTHHCRFILLRVRF
jgi:hypothetical protein